MEYYAWRVRGKPVEVRLSVPMVRFMVPWLHDRAAGQVQLFGMLLGRSRRGWRRTIVFVDDFEPFDPATLRGVPKPPHGTELIVVGLYRRREGDELKLDRLDASLIQTSFVHPGMVYLLLAPASGGPDRAAFYIQERGEIHGYTNYAEFPFDAQFLSAPPPAAPQSNSRRWISFAGLGASLLALAGWFVWLRKDPVAPVAPQPVAQQPRVEPSPVPDPPKAITSPRRAPAPKHKKSKPTTARRKRRRSTFNR